MTVIEILDELHIDYLRSGHHHARPGWVQIKDCPFCGSHNYHLGINLSGNYAVCWKCRGHHLPKVLIELGLSHDQAWTFYRGIDTLPAVEKRERSRVSAKEPAGKGPLLAPHRRYLRSRGFDPDSLVQLWGVGGIGISSRLSWRVYIPIDWNHKTVSWTTRSISAEADQRYISASAEEESVNHKEILYGLDYCHHSIVIVEGPFDVWKIGPGAAALFGTAYTEQQIAKVVKFPRRYVCFDSEGKAQEQAKELCQQLSVFPGITENIVLDAKDPGSAPEEELEQVRAFID